MLEVGEDPEDAEHFKVSLVCGGDTLGHFSVGVEDTKVLSVDFETNEKFRNRGVFRRMFETAMDICEIADCEMFVMSTKPTVTKFAFDKGFAFEDIHIESQRNNILHEIVTSDDPSRVFKKLHKDGRVNMILKPGLLGGSRKGSFFSGAALGLAVLALSSAFPTLNRL